MSTTNQLSKWSRFRAARSVGREVPAWALSLILHMTAIFTLAACTILAPTVAPELLLPEPVEVELGKVADEYHYSEDPAATIGAPGVGTSEGGQPLALSENVEAQIASDVRSVAPLAAAPTFEVDRTILKAPESSENLLLRGAGSIGTSGAEGAVDRLTNEILLSLDDRPTLVVWLFDQSGSLKAQREAIAQRFDHVYDELGVIEAAGNPAFRRHQDKPLLTAVASFGQGVQLLIPKPTDDVKEVKAAVRAVKDDTSGRENVFQSVSYLADKFRHYRLQTPRRNVMIVVFTDEAGDDPESLDSTVELCRKLAIPVYVVGMPAPFGREEAYVKWVDPDPNFDQTPQWISVHQGPESVMPERIKLGFVATEEQEEQVDSGFGPFGLCRLASETGGLYFAVHPNRKVGGRVESDDTNASVAQLKAFFDETVMRNYRPDYVSTDEYHKLLSRNRACAALVEAAELSWTSPMENVRLRFPKADDSQFARELSQAQRSAAKLEPQIERLVTTLRQGEPDRPKITKPRWQAGFDLAIGRALAVKVRTEGYNAMLAEAKQGLKFKNEKDDTWILRPDKDVTINSALAKDAADAKKYLERVVADNTGTPWEMEAKRELEQPLGWQWRERFTDVAGRQARAEANRGNRPKPDENTPPQKPRRDPPAL